MDPFANFLKNANTLSYNSLEEELTDLNKSQKLPQKFAGHFLFDRQRKFPLVTCEDCEHYIRICCGTDAWNLQKINYDFAQYRQDLQYKKYTIRQHFRLAVKHVIMETQKSKGGEPYKDFFAVTFKLKTHQRRNYRQLFRDAGKRIILENRVNDPSSDPWDRFFHLLHQKSRKKSTVQHANNRKEVSASHRKPRIGNENVDKKGKNASQAGRRKSIKVSKDPFAKHFLAEAEPEPEEFEQHESEEQSLLNEPTDERQGTPMRRAPSKLEKSIIVPDVNDRGRERRRWSSENSPISDETRGTTASRNSTLKSVDHNQRRNKRFLDTENRMRHPSNITRLSTESSAFEPPFPEQDSGTYRVPTGNELPKPEGHDGKSLLSVSMQSIDGRSLKSSQSKKLSSAELAKVVERLCRPLDKRVHSKAVRDMLRQDRSHSVRTRNCSRKELNKIVDRLSTLPKIRPDPVTLSGEYRFDESLRKYNKGPKSSDNDLSAVEKQEKLPKINQQTKNQRRSQKYKVPKLGSTPDLLNRF